MGFIEADVSIPHWFDSSQPSCIRTPACETVSIPHWFDSSGKDARKGVHHERVSIPHWFDSSLLAAAPDETEG